MLKIINYKHLLFFFIIALQMVIYNYPYIAKIEPRTIHAWRQFDCLSFAQNFQNNRSTLTEPCLNNLGSKGNGKSASEFPIVQFLIGNIWKITGVNILVYRLVNLMFIWFGLFYLYKLFLFEFKNKIISALIAGLIFTSPILSYYGISTISDVQSFSLSLIGFYFFYQWFKLKNKFHLLLFILFFALAGLLKASSSMLYIICLLFILFSAIEQKKKMTDIFTKANLVFSLYLCVPFLFWVSWYFYARDYNLKNNSEFFLIGVLPIWSLETERIYSVLRALTYNLIPQIISPFILFSVFIFIVANSFVNFKKHVASSFLLVSCLGIFILFVLLFFDACDVHDYYFINIIGVLCITIFLIFKIIPENFRIKQFKLIVFILGFLVLINTYTSGIKTWKKINFNVTNFENSIVFNSFEQKEYFWIYWLDRKMYKILEGDKMNLDEIGIKKSDTIICLGDQTINRSLFLLNRLGYTSYNTDNKNAVSFLNTHKSVKYLVLIDPGMRGDTNLTSLLTTKLFDKDSLAIYKVNN